MYIIKVVNVQCYVYKKEYSQIGSSAPSLLSSIFVDKNHIAHICLPQYNDQKCYVYKQSGQCYVYKKEYSLSSPITQLILTCLSSCCIHNELAIPHWLTCTNSYHQDQQKCYTYKQSFSMLCV